MKISIEISCRRNVCCRLRINKVNLLVHKIYNYILFNLYIFDIFIDYRITSFKTEWKEEINQNIINYDFGSHVERNIHEIISIPDGCCFGNIISVLFK